MAKEIRKSLLLENPLERKSELMNFSEEGALTA